jgi:2-aminoethylphosphonate-pyruvate transaminase
MWRGPAPAAGSVYLDLFDYHRAQHGAGFSPFTQAVPLAFALNEALAELCEQGGWQARREMYRYRAERVSGTLTGCGVRTLIDPAEYSAVLWSYELPDGMTYPSLHDALKRDRFVIYAGQGDLGRHIFRIAHMGDIREEDLERLCTALRRVLAGRG